MVVAAGATVPVCWLMVFTFSGSLPGFTTLHRSLVARSCALGVFSVPTAAVVPSVT